MPIKMSPTGLEPGAGQSIATDDKQLDRLPTLGRPFRPYNVCSEQNVVLLMFMHRWPDLRPHPWGDVKMDSVPGDSHRWLQLTSILNAIGVKHSPSEWRKYVQKTCDELLAEIRNHTDTDAESQFQWQPLERGLAQMLWPDRFGEFTPVLQPETIETSTNGSRSDTVIQIQIDLIAHFLQHNPAMWYTTNRSNAVNTTDDWLLLVDVLNTVGSRRTTGKWHQFLSKLVYTARTAKRYKMTWFERQMSELWNGGAILTMETSSMEHLLCADIFRTDTGQLLYICNLCDEECAGESLFGLHCRDWHGLDVDCVAEPAQELPTISCSDDLMCKLEPPDEQTLSPVQTIFVDTVAMPLEIKRESFEQTPTAEKPMLVDSCAESLEIEPEQPIFVDTSAEPLAIKQEVDEHTPSPGQSIFVDTGAEPSEIKLEHDAEMMVDIKEEPELIDESLNELEAESDHEEFTWRYIDAEKSPAAATTPSLPFICDICQRQFKHKISLTNHIDQHIPIMTNAGRKKNDKWAPNHRKNTALCYECELPFDSRPERDKHFQSVHMIPLDPAVATAYTFVSAKTKNGRRKHRFVCPECSTQFKLQIELRQHYMEQHALSSKIYFDEQPDQVSDVSPEGPRYRCNLCGFAHLQRAIINQHMFTHSSVESFMCSRCPFRGRTRNILTQHRKTVHSDDLPKVACEWCAYRTTDRFKMECHRRLHTGELPYVCTVADCRQAFRLKPLLRTHYMSTHYVAPPADESNI